VITGKTIAQLNRQLLAIIQGFCLIWFFQAADLRLGNIRTSRSIADGHAASTLVMECDAQSQKLDQPFWKRPFGCHRPAERQHSHGKFRRVSEHSRDA
jgi:hypothetical protein